MSFIEACDFLAKEFKFQIEGRKKYQTILGGLLSIILTVAVIYISYYFGKELWEHKSPILLEKKSLLDDFPMINLTQKDFNVAFRLENDNGDFYSDPSLFEYYFYYQYYKQNNDTGYYELYKSITAKPVVCNTSYVPQAVLDKEKLNNYLCVNNTYQAGGDWSSTFLAFPSVYIMPCNKMTEERYNITCASKKDLAEVLKNNIMYLDVIIQKDLVDPNSFQRERIKSYHYNYWPLSTDPNETKLVIVEYTKAQLDYDFGVLFEDHQKSQYIEYNDVVSFNKRVLGAIDPILGDHPICEVRIMINRSFKQYFIYYTKLQDVLVIVGGLMNVVVITFELFYLPFWNNDYSYYMHTKLFKLEVEFDDKEQPKEFIDQGKIEDFKEEKTKIELVLKNVKELEQLNEKYEEENQDYSTKKIIKDNQEISLIKRNKYLKNKEETILNKDIYKLLEPVKKRRDEIKLNKIERIIFTYCNCSRERQSKDDQSKLKYEMLQAASALLNKKVEILEVLKLNDQFRLMKQIILNESQCFMLANRNLHTIVNNINNLNHKNIDNINEEKHKTKFENLIFYLNDRKNHMTLNDIDLLLYKNLDYDLKEEVKKRIVLEDREKQ